MINSDTETVPKEHERRFIPDMEILPFLFWRFPMEFIIQGYLEDPLKTRIRHTYNHKKHVYTQTRKSGSGVSRDEDECFLEKEDFEEKWKRVRCSLVKSRYFVAIENKYENVSCQLNIFHDELAGYVQIESEFKTHEEAISFIPPSWFGKEVTDDERHGNYSLAKNGIPPK